MADKKISALDPVLEAEPADELPIARTNTTKKLTVQQVVDAAQAGAVLDGDAAGGVLDGTYPSPGLSGSVAGSGLAETADVLSVNVDGTTIEITADALNVKSGVFQPLDATLTALAGQNWAANAIPIGTGADTLAQTAFAANTFPARSSAGNLAAKTITDFGLSLVDDTDAATARSTLGLGSIATQASNNVAITGGSITGITDLALADGGTGATLVDPNADRIMFWDDSAGAVTWLAPGTGLTITGTTIDASTTPSGAAGGVLDGTYPNPGLAAAVAGSGLAETADVLSVNVDDSTIEISTDTLRVKDAGITAAKLATAPAGSVFLFNYLTAR